MTKFNVILMFDGEEKEITVDTSIFRAYDIRGIADSSGGEAVTLTPDVAYVIGQGLGTKILDSGCGRVIVGRDARTSSEALSSALVQGILSTGCHAVNIGLAPTSVVHYAMEKLRITSAITITASHNPGHHNGIKIVVNNETLAADKITALSQCIQDQEFHEGNGKEIRHIGILEQYINDTTNVQLSRPIKVIIDPLHGITGLIAEKIFRKLSPNVIMLHADVLPDFGGLEADPSQPKNLEALRDRVIAKKADIGFGFDGDGDRIGIITNQGEFISADRLLMLLAQNITKQYKETEIVFDVKCSKNLASIIEAGDGKPIMSRTGRSFILQEMQKNPQRLLGGEKSGHIFLSPVIGGTGYDDGILAAIQVLKILSNQPKSIAELFDALPKSVCTPELSLICKTDAEKWALMENILHQVRFEDAEQIITIDGLRVEYKEGWGLVRPSNTSAKLVFVFEAASEIALKTIQQKFSDQLLKIVPNLALPFEHVSIFADDVSAKSEFTACADGLT